MRKMIPGVCLAVTLSLMVSGVAGVQTAPGGSPGSGELRCNVKGGFGVVVSGTRPVTCTYRRLGRPVEFYTGYSDTLGFDVGPSNANVVRFRVSADPTVPGALQGDFNGATIGIAPNTGFSGTALVGPAGVSLVALPNTATTAFTGINARVGIGRLHLELQGVEANERYRIRRVLREYGLEDYHQ